MNIIRLIYILLLLPFAATAFAQVSISGKVTDSENAPIEFATVRIAGTAIGAMTDLAGKYSITIAKQDTIDVIFPASDMRK